MTPTQIDQLNRLRAGVDDVAAAIKAGSSIEAAFKRLDVVIAEARKALSGPKGTGP